MVIQFFAKVVSANTAHITNMPSIAQPPPATPAYLRARQIAARYSISTAMVFKLVRMGRLSAKRVGRTVLIPYDEARRFFGETDDVE